MERTYHAFINLYPLYLYKDDTLKIIYTYFLHIQKYPHHRSFSTVHFHDVAPWALVLAHHSGHFRPARSLCRHGINATPFSCPAAWIPATGPSPLPRRIPSIVFPTRLSRPAPPFFLCPSPTWFTRHRSSSSARAATFSVARAAMESVVGHDMDPNGRPDTPSPSPHLLRVSHSNPITNDSLKPPFASSTARILPYAATKVAPTPPSPIAAQLCWWEFDSCWQRRQPGAGRIIPSKWWVDSQV
jgi:hypothetical protein